MTQLEKKLQSQFTPILRSYLHLIWKGKRNLKNVNTQKVQWGCQGLGGRLFNVGRVAVLQDEEFTGGMMVTVNAFHAAELPT